MDGGQFRRGLIFGLGIRLVEELFGMMSALGGMKPSTVGLAVGFLLYGALGWWAVGTSDSQEAALRKGMSLGVGAATMSWVVLMLLMVWLGNGPDLPLPLLLIVSIFAEFKFAAATVVVARWRFQRTWAQRG